MSTATPDVQSPFTVVYVEDDERLAQLTTRYLEGHGVAVMHAATGPEGLRLALSGKADVVLLDLMLPGLDGMDLCAQVRARSDVPIVMLTARDGEVDRVRGLEGARTTTWPSRSRRGNSSPGCARRCAASAPGPGRRPGTSPWGRSSSTAAR